MNAKQFAILMILAALWGGSFLFMRVAVPEFGPISLIALRAGIAALFLLPVMLLLKRPQLHQITPNIKSLIIVAFFNIALPFVLIAYALLQVTSGVGSVLNATTPMFGALIGWLWLRHTLSNSALLGLVLGFIGVFILVGDKLSGHQSYGILPIFSALLATASYGFAVNYSRETLHGVDSLVIATTTQTFAALMLLPLAVIYWPPQTPGLIAWINVTALGILSTGIAFILYFYLLKQIGAVRLTTVTFYIPVFGISFGVLLLGEQIGLQMLLGAVIIVCGTMLSSGFWAIRRLERQYKQQMDQ
ncbi:MAG: EamA family transporter [Thiothrix nivea]|nr:MAG: EamA family transporter [Thiothrix nivea]